MTDQDLVTYWEHCVSTVDIVDLYRQIGGRLNRNNRGKCLTCGHETLYLNREWHSFRCLNLLCNDHGDVVSLIQRTAELSFPVALAILDSGRCRHRWSRAELEEFGAVRDCMTAAALFCVSHLSHVETYMNQRGIPTRLAQQFLVGGGLGKEPMKHHLLDKGFSSEVIRSAGLMNEDDHDRFQEHVIVPLREYGQIFDFCGHYVGHDPAIGKDWFLPAHRLVVGGGYFNWHTDRDQIICTQGIFDALFLLQNGFYNVVATGTDKILDPMSLQGTNIRRVWFWVSCVDAERERLLEAAYRCLEAGVDVRMIVMPSGIGPNEFCLTHSIADFHLLLVNAKTVEHWERDQPAP